MKLTRKIRREFALWPVMRRGYSRKMASAWYKRTSYDNRRYADVCGKKTLRDIHRRGYLYRSLERYDLLRDRSDHYITDFDYIRLAPYNSSFSKWIGDMLTTRRVLAEQRAHCPEVYYTIFRRCGERMLLRVADVPELCGIAELADMVREKGAAMLRSPFWTSRRARYKLTWDDGLCVDGEPVSDEAFGELLDRLRGQYVLSEYIPAEHTFPSGLHCRHYVKFWLANDAGEDAELLDSEIYLRPDGENWCSSPIAADGTFTADGRAERIDGWEMLRDAALQTARSLPQLSFFTVSAALDDAGSFHFISFSAAPHLPENRALSERMNDYLKERLAQTRTYGALTLRDRLGELRRILHRRFLRMTGRRGVRPYMQQLWLDALKSDWKNTRTTTPLQKLWCWRRGFQSFRIEQYGLTKENYRRFLSDYDYYWLNRINNVYQIWVNDKTTFRYILDPFRAYIPTYYFSVFKRRGETVVSRMQDCDADIPGGMEGLLAMLRRRGVLVFKPSSGTHGDGFYRLAWEDGAYTVNGEETDEEGLRALIGEQKSFYVVTEYVHMHRQLSAIYPKSVNTIRMMVINRHGCDPQIMQTYMRIGSSRTGYTDNVGYGGICVMIDPESGELFQPETIENHRFHPCPVHPDTGTPVEGTIPHWPLIREKVLAISRYLAQLEYLGYDIAVTEDGFQVIEINIHQDLHKVATHSDAIRAFFAEKIADKRKIYHIKGE